MIDTALHWFCTDWNWAWVLAIVVGILVIALVSTGSKYWDGFLDALIVDSWFD